MNTHTLNLFATLKPYEMASVGKALWQLSSTLVLFASGLVLMYLSLQVSYLLYLILAILTSGFAIRIFIIMHDCGHGSFLPSHQWNNIIGWATGVLTATPYVYWRDSHAKHHASSGDLERRGVGDIKTLTVREYKRLSAKRQLKYRLYRNPWVLLLGGPLFLLFKQRWPVGSMADARVWRSVMSTNFALAGLVVFFSWLIGPWTFVFVWLIVILISGSAGVFLFYVQHQFEDTYWYVRPTWQFSDASIQGSSYLKLPKVPQWFTGNIGFHHLHHLDSRIANYHLEKCQRETTVTEQVTILTLGQAVRTLTLGLWDERQSKLIRFKDLR